MDHVYGPRDPWLATGQVVTKDKSLISKIGEAVVEIGKAIVYIITFKWLF